MITYDHSPLGLFDMRVPGSACCRAAAVMGLISVLLSVLLHKIVSPDQKQKITHPNGIGILISSITLLLVFRLQQAYARYWEATSACFHLQSRFMDATLQTAICHMQCDHYNHIKPPSFNHHHNLNKECLSRDREVVPPFVGHENCPASGSYNAERVRRRARAKSIECVDSGRPMLVWPSPIVGISIRSITKSSTDDNLPLPPTKFQGGPVLDGNWGNLFTDGKSTFMHPQHVEQKDVAGFASHQGGRTAPLFLQELAHLSSLLLAVAFTTLRNDIEGTESPLDIYKAGSPWPPVDPGKVYEHEEFPVRSKRFWSFLGMGRSPADRTRYNTSRPLPVIGGVSPAEIRFLQMARGPYAKTQLCMAWLTEFLMREHLNGSLATAGSAVVSRLLQFLSDGMTQYNHARKISFIPFPFPHAQLSAFYVLVTVPAVVALMDQYADNLRFGCTLAFFIVTCLASIHEVARELENPFRNIPNELPLVTLQAQYNEALLVMYAGYHPDLFWLDEARMYEAETLSKSSVSPESALPRDLGNNANELAAAAGTAIAVTASSVTATELAGGGVWPIRSPVETVATAAVLPEREGDTTAAISRNGSFDTQYAAAAAFLLKSHLSKSERLRKHDF